VDILLTVNVLVVTKSDEIVFWFTIFIELIFVAFKVFKFNKPEVIEILFIV